MNKSFSGGHLCRRVLSGPGQHGTCERLGGMIHPGLAGSVTATTGGSSVIFFEMREPHQKGRDGCFFLGGVHGGMERNLSRRE